MDIDEGTRHSAGGFSSLGYVASALLAIAIMVETSPTLLLLPVHYLSVICLGLQNMVSNFFQVLSCCLNARLRLVTGLLSIIKKAWLSRLIFAQPSCKLEKGQYHYSKPDLLSSVVTNLTHGDRYGRVDVKVGVAYGSDVERVSEALLEAAAENKKF